MEKEYEMPAGAGESEFTDRKSVFLGHVMPVKSEEEALDFVKQMKKKYGDARHNVWAFALHNGAMRSSDDGEPQGTGGAPVLDAILKKGLTVAVVVVTRYFGGILLGTGGLVHAYSNAAVSALDAAGRVRAVPHTLCALTCEYAQYGMVCRLCEKYGALELSAEYTDRVGVSFLLPPGDFEPYGKDLREQSAGSLTLENKGEKVLALSVKGR